MIKKVILWVLVIFLSAQIFAFSSDNSKKSSEKSGRITNAVVTVVKKIPQYSKVDDKTLIVNIEPVIRKCAHFFIYMCLSFAVLELFLSYNVKFSKAVLYAAVYCLIYAMADEFHQLFVDGRSGQIKDVFIDFSGSLLAFLVRFLIYRLMKIKKKYNFS